MSNQFNSVIATERLSLVPTTAQHVRAELEGNSVFSAVIGATVPESWPPGQYDRDAQEYFLGALTETGETGVGWYGWYAVRPGDQGGEATVIGCGGYFGPPAPDGVVEIGYSVCPEWQGQGFASDLVRALVEHVRPLPAVSRIIAHTHADNGASLAVLAKCGFVQAEETDQPGTVLFEWRASNTNS